MVTSFVMGAGVSPGIGGTAGAVGSGGFDMPPRVERYASSSERSTALSDEGTIVSMGGGAAVSDGGAGGEIGAGSGGTCEFAPVDDRGTGGVGKGVSGKPISGTIGS